MSALIKYSILFFVISGAFLSFFPSVHMALILSFLWTVALMYRYGHKLVSDKLHSGIEEISCAIRSLNKQQETLENQINTVSNDIMKSKIYFNEAVNKARQEAKDVVDKRKIMDEELFNQQRQKYQQIFKSIEDEYGALVRQKLTELIIAKLTSKIQDPANIENITLTGINNALHAINNMQKIS